VDIVVNMSGCKASASRNYGLLLILINSHIARNSDHCANPKYGFSEIRLFLNVFVGAITATNQ